jgi:2'-deoxynucleoside 5'-phosphate N-hydrolase
MKVYFTASYTGAQSFGKNYFTIVETLKRLGHDVITEAPFNMKSDPRPKEPVEKRTEVHKRIMKEIERADLIVAETSFPSTGVGYEVTVALEKEKPVLVLHVEGRTPVLLLGADFERLRVEEYSLSNLTQVLRFSIDELSTTVDTRFNFFISPKISNYLDWVSKNKRIPRAVYLRRLIEEDMKKNKDFEK